MTPVEKELQRIHRNELNNFYKKRNGYASQKKYRAAHPEMYRDRYYTPRVRIPIENKDTLLGLLDECGMTTSELFISMVEEQYGIDLKRSKK